MPTHHRRTAAVAAAALSIGSVTAIAAATAGAAPTTHAHKTSHWASTNTKALHLAGTSLGHTRSTKTLHLSIAVAPRHAAAMHKELRAVYTPGSADYHQYLSAKQWKAKYAPRTARVAKVTSYLHSAGLTGVHVAADHLLISANTTAAKAEKAFHTSLVSYRDHGHTLFANSKPAQVPSSLSGIVTAVAGLNNVPLKNVKPTVVHPKQATPKAAGSPDLEGGLFPDQFKTTYDAKGTTTGSKTSVAILSEGAAAPVVKTLRYAESKEGLHKVPVSVVKVGAQSTDTSGADEFDMDSQFSTGVAGSVKHLYFYNIGQLTDGPVDADFARFVSDDKAKALSASIGGCEYSSYLDGSETAVDTLMQEGALQGQSLFASSGDEGDACALVANTGTPAGVPSLEWPAAGEYNTAVGGTSLISDANGNRISELAWLGGGGGVSEFENGGFWTQDTNATYAAADVRESPDVALDADPNVATPAKVYVGKTIDYVGGTSLSSPMMLGFWARMESTHHNNLGLASVALYRVYDKVNPGTSETTPAGITVTVPSADPKAVPGFTDITEGTNGTYDATPGYDLTTGLGAPDVKALDAVIAKK